jgi:hypothetical protein
MNANLKLQQRAARRGNYVLLTADTLHLLLPQHEVGAAEYLDGTLEAAEESGLLKLRGKDSPRRFAALSAGMTLLPNCPPGRFLVTPLGEGGDSLGWCWNELQILIDVELVMHPLPEVLLARDTPVKQYVELEGKLAYVCSAEQLFAYALQPRAE